jgi:hypothetical protein
VRHDQQDLSTFKNIFYEREVHHNANPAGMFVRKEKQEINERMLLTAK